MPFNSASDAFQQLVGGATTTHRAKIEKSMPRKRGLASMGYEKALETFHKNVLAAVLRHVDFAKIKVRSIHWSPYDRVGVVNAVP